MSKYAEYKAKVLAVSQQLCAEGYFGTKMGSGGNVSMLIEGEDLLAITPSGLNYAQLTAEDICIVNFKGGRIEGAHEPSVETGMHTAVYRNRKDVNAVIHTHQPYASILAVLNEPIPPMFDETVVSIGPGVEVVPYALSGTQDLLNNVVAALPSRCQCYLLQNHGALCIAATIEKAHYFVELLEKNAKVYCRALATGKTVNVLPDPLPQGLFQMTQMKQDMEIARKEAMKANAG